MLNESPSSRISGKLMVAVLLTLVVLCTIGYFVWWEKEVAPLDGDIVHDFGAIDVIDGSGSAKHVFKLTNNADRTFTIKAVRESCKCVQVAEDVTGPIEPGATVEIPVQITLEGSGKRTENVTVITDALDPIRLDIVAHGRRVPALWNMEPQVLLLGQPREVVFFAEVWDKAAARVQPTAEVTSGGSAQVTGWASTGPDSSDENAPVIWRGTVNVTPEDIFMPEDAELVIRWRDEQPIRVKLMGAQRPQENPAG